MNRISMAKFNAYCEYVIENFKRKIEAKHKRKTKIHFIFIGTSNSFTKYAERKTFKELIRVNFINSSSLWRIRLIQILRTLKIFQALRYVLV